MTICVCDLNFVMRSNCSKILFLIFKNIYKVIDLGYAKQADQAGLCHSFVGTQYYLVSEVYLLIYSTTLHALRSGLEFP